MNTPFGGMAPVPIPQPPAIVDPSDDHDNNGVVTAGMNEEGPGDIDYNYNISNEHVQQINDLMVNEINDDVMTAGGLMINMNEEGTDDEMRLGDPHRDSFIVDDDDDIMTKQQKDNGQNMTPTGMNIDMEVRQSMIAPFGDQIKVSIDGDVDGLDDINNLMLNDDMLVDEINNDTVTMGM